MLGSERRISMSKLMEKEYKRYEDIKMICEDGTEFFGCLMNKFYIGG